MCDVKKSIGSSEKAEIALKALKGVPVAELVDTYGVSVEAIEEWTKQVEETVPVIFEAGSSDSFICQQMELFTTVLEAVPSGVMVTNLDGQIITFNQQCIEMWGVPQHIAEDNDIYKAMDYVEDQLENPESFRDQVQKMYEDPKTVVWDSFEFKDGRIFQRHSIPYREKETIVGRVTSFLDITEHIRAEQKAHRYSSMIDSITTNVNEGILRSTPERGLIYVNDAFVKMFGYGSREEILETPPERFYADKDKRWTLLEKVRSESQIKNEEIKFQRKDGSTFWGLENSILIENGDETYIDGVVHDISELKEAENALRESEEKYKAILKNIEEGYFETDLEGNFTFFNRALRKMIGYSRQELEGMNNREYMDEKNARKVYDTFNRVYRTGEPERGFDWELIRYDGSRIYVEASVNLRKDSDDNPIGFRGIVRDVTERKQKEQQIKSSLKEKEVLLGEIHHRVKNNLAVISGLLFLQADKTDDSSAYNLLKQSQSRINSMAIVHEMLYENQTFSSIAPGKYIHQLVEHIQKNYSVEDKDIDIDINTDNMQLNMNMAIPCALIINELITNAYKYAFNGCDTGKIEVGLYRENGSYILEVRDNGVGMPENQLTDKDSKGLGLFLVETLTEQLEGELSINSNDGSHFKITFPAPN